MSRIRSKNTTPEKILKKQLDGRILRYQPKGIDGNPDFANKKKKIAVFVDGCFWHGCPKCRREPKSRKNYWNLKIQRNKKRDDAVNAKLRRKGWKIIRCWECQVHKNPKGTALAIIRRTMNAKA